MRYKEYKVLEESEPYTHETLLDARMSYFVTQAYFLEAFGLTFH